MKIGVVTLFPEMFQAITDYGVTGRGCRQAALSVQTVNPRDFTHDRHRTVDDRPYGGGPGMLMKVEPLRAAIGAAREQVASEGVKPRVIYLSPQGRKLDQRGVEELAARPNMVLVCGRYEGIDERVIEAEVDEEWSLGDFILSGGELAAMALVDAVARLQPGVLGHELSAEQDSFSDGLLDCPHYTRPEVLEGVQVPDVLLSGNHEKIRQWRLKQSLTRTWLRRPELLAGRESTNEEKRLLAEILRELADDEDSSS
ncbi:tRNA (guanine37-N(1)-) methyltransferase [Sinobacterium caligoides]|uniref:tRNA (guanine-N(1)-)-methyltransferase n=1 Tax=Sinobacterium caligoides TaxID=933926 RepID=A0A3N2DZA5_9GAMM|nr:tRNA (guanosine(37)-N1)-methyltransferase TrmD [Sinobacterium caligoides]ROS05211.1 tRNA (guanine37-N(1)-) methyltransferase [Sinobacterium caligoides]